MRQLSGDGKLNFTKTDRLVSSAQWGRRFRLPTLEVDPRVGFRSFQPEDVALVGQALPPAHSRTSTCAELGLNAPIRGCRGWQAERLPHWAKVSDE